jgi:glucan phosphorylase
LLDVEGMDAEQIARKAMNIAADLCVYTNHTHIIEVLDSVKKDTKWINDLIILILTIIMENLNTLINQSDNYTSDIS